MSALLLADQGLNEIVNPLRKGSNCWEPAEDLPFQSAYKRNKLRRGILEIAIVKTARDADNRPMTCGRQCDPGRALMKWSDSVSKMEYLPFRKDNQGILSSAQDRH